MSKVKRLYKKDVINKVFWGNCIDVMDKLPEEVADLVFIDPPYYLQLQTKKLIRWSGSVVNGVNDEWDKFKSFEDYDKFIVKVLEQVKRLMKPRATIWVIGMYHNIHRIGKIMQDLGFWILNDVIWFKTNPMPNFLGVRFTNATETLIWAVKDRKVKGYKFDKNKAIEFSPTKLHANIWNIPLCSGKERLRDRKGNKIHSTQKPEELMKRIILTSSDRGGVILDPMAGTGTTGYVATRLGRRFIMIENKKEYIDAISKRLKKINSNFSVIKLK